MYQMGQNCIFFGGKNEIHLSAEAVEEKNGLFIYLYIKLLTCAVCSHGY
jgi:hypothetical protein